MKVQKGKLNMSRLGIGAGVFALVLGLAACASPETINKDEQGSADAVAAAVEATQLAQQPLTFEAPGPDVDLAPAAGKKLFIVDLASSIPVIDTADKATAEALGMAGATVVRYDGKGQVSEFARGVNQAIAENADAIALFAIDPKSVEGPLREAHDAGIKIIVVQYDNPDVALPDYVDAQATYSYSDAGTQMANFIVSASEGVSTGVQLITTSDVTNSQTLVDNFTDTLMAGCPGCKIVTNDIPVANWEADIPTQVSAALTSNPDIEWVVPIYDGMAIFAEPAIQTSGSTGVQVVSFNASDAVMRSLQDGGLVAADVGSPQAWEGYAVADQFFRLMAGEPALEDTQVGLRLFTAENIGEINLDEPEADWYGVDYEAVYLSMWGLS